MRRRWVLMGGTIAVAGLLLAFFPLSHQSSGPRFIPSASSEYVITYQAPLDLLFPRVQYAVQWNGTEDAMNLTVLACGSDANCAHPSSPLAVGHGLYGKLAFLGAANVYYEIVPQGGAANITVDYDTPLLGGALGVGMLLGGIGVFSVGLTGRPPAEGEETDDDEPDELPP